MQELTSNLLQQALLKGINTDKDRTQEIQVKSIMLVNHIPLNYSYFNENKNPLQGSQPGNIAYKKPAAYANGVWLKLIFQKHHEGCNRHVLKCYQCFPAQNKFTGGSVFSNYR